MGILVLGRGVAAALMSITISMSGPTVCPLTSGMSFLGSGGTSSGVYQLTANTVLKESIGTVSSAALLENECRILKRLEAARVKNVVRCLSECFVAASGRPALVLAPFIDQRNQDADSMPLNSKTALEVIRAVTQSLVVAHVASSDLQLIKDGDSVVLIDWDQAKSWEEDSELPEALVRSFLQEAFSLIPADDQGQAAGRRSLAEAIVEIERERPGLMASQPKLSAILDSFVEVEGM